jgi:hypothetical protein
MSFGRGWRSQSPVNAALNVCRQPRSRCATIERPYVPALDLRPSLDVPPGGLALRPSAFPAPLATCSAPSLWNYRASGVGNQRLGFWLRGTARPLSNAVRKNSIAIRVAYPEGLEARPACSQPATASVSDPFSRGSGRVCRCAVVDSFLPDPVAPSQLGVDQPERGQHREQQRADEHGPEDQDGRSLALQQLPELGGLRPPSGIAFGPGHDSAFRRSAEESCVGEGARTPRVAATRTPGRGAA